MQYSENILGTIGNTPMVRLNKVTAEIDALVLAKVETFNPGNSTKDRMALKMVEDAENIIQSLNLSGGDSAQGTGRGLNVSLTPFWSSKGATNKTPKTDVILGDKKISVKVGNSQLMSGGKEESMATFYAAMEDTPDLLDSPEAKSVINTFDKFVKKGITDPVIYFLKKPVL